MLTNIGEPAVTIRRRVLAWVLAAGCWVPAVGCEESPQPRFEYYVAPDGDDDAAGSIDAPFASVARAQQAVREDHPQLQHDVTVFLRGGRYHLDQPLVFTVEDGGRDGHTVTYRAYTDEAPLIMGGRPVSGWEPTNLGPAELDVYRADISQLGDGVVYTLLENGRRGWQARSPNHGYHRAQDGAEGWIQYRDGDLPTDLAVTSTTSLLLLTGNSKRHFKDGPASVTRLSAVAGDTRTLSFADPIYKRAFPDTRYFVQGAPELLDAVGEFFVDSQAGHLYYAPREATDRSTGYFGPDRGPRFGRCWRKRDRSGFQPSV